MINKLDLVSIISKYFLNGKNEAVKWDIVDNKLTIKFKAPDKSITNTSLNNVDYLIFLPDTSSNQQNLLNLQLKEEKKCNMQNLCNM